MNLPIIAACFSFPAVALWAVKLTILVPLVLACLVLIILIPSAAWRGKLSVPIYALVALGAGLVALVAGKFAGAHSVQGTMLGIAISFLFFLLVALAAGCFLGLVFYRHRRQD